MPEHVDPVDDGDVRGSQNWELGTVRRHSKCGEQPRALWTICAVVSWIARMTIVNPMHILFNDWVFHILVIKVLLLPPQPQFNIYSMFGWVSTWWFLFKLTIFIIFGSCINSWSSLIHLPLRLSFMSVAPSFGLSTYLLLFIVIVMDTTSLLWILKRVKPNQSENPWDLSRFWQIQSNHHDSPLFVLPNSMPDY